MSGFNKKVILIALILSAAALVFYAQQKDAIYKKVISDNEALLIFDYGQGKQRWFKGEVVSGMTIKDAVEASSRAGEFDFEANGQLVELNGFSSNQKAKWSCFVNHREVKEGIDVKAIYPQDKVVCKYK